MKTEEIVIIVVAVIVFLVFAGGFSGYNMMGYGGMMGMMSGAYGFGSMMLFGWIFSILLLVALVLFIVWLIKQLQKK